MRACIAATAVVVIVAAALASAAHTPNGTVCVTGIVGALTTYCSTPTSVVQGTQTYTVTTVSISTFSSQTARADH